MEQRKWFLKHYDLFSELAPQQIQRIESKSRARSYATGSPIYLPTEDVDSVFVLTSGLVKVAHPTTAGKESILAFVEPGELFGESAVFGEVARDEYVKAVKPSTVVMIPAEEMKLLISERADLAMRVTRMIGMRRQRVERRLKHLLFKSNRERLVHVLLDLAQQFGWEAEDGIRLRLQISHQDLASMIGSTRESVTVILNELKSAGTIENARRKIVLTSPTRLAHSVKRVWHFEAGQETRPHQRRWPALATD